MATYGSLLLDAGGGIIDPNKQAERSEDVTVIIGLGGTGADAVIALKRKVYKYLKPDNVGEAVPKYDNIKYLIIDSDDAKVRSMRQSNCDINKTTEFFSISNKAIKATFASKEILKNRPELDWLDYEHILIDDTWAGTTCAIRQVGRFLLVNKSDYLYKKIKDTLLRVWIETRGRLTVHICTGLGGGTGSGIYLDICYLVRKALEELGIAQTKVCGYFFLPDVNLSKLEISANPIMSRVILENGFAALKELDYCMSFDKNNDHFQMNYGFLQIDTSHKPVDLCYLISAANEQGDEFENGYNTVMEVAADYIMAFLEGEYDISLMHHIAGFEDIISIQHGASVDYSVFGIATAELPISEITTYLGHKLFECYSDLYDRVPTESERNDFLSSIHLKYEDIRTALTKDCIGMINFPKRFNERYFKEHGNGKLIEFADEYLARNKGILKTNAKIFIEEFGEFGIPEAHQSFIGRTYEGLYNQYITQLEYGPFFAQRILYGTGNHNLIHAVDGFIAENQANMEVEVRQNQIRLEEYEDALLAMQNASFLNANGRMKSYLNALNNLYVHHYRVEMYQTMDMVLKTYRDQLSKLNHNFFRVLTTVLDNLRDTFKENGKVLTQGGKSTNSYSWKILDVSNVQKTLDTEVRNLNLQNTLHELMTTMMDNCTKWINMDENKITKLISDFIVTTFSGMTQKTFSEYLSIKLGTTHPQQLQQCIENGIIQNMGKISVPLFWKNPMFNNEVSMKKILTVPYDSAEIKAAANHYAMRHDCVIRESMMTDKISMMCIYSGRPMYAYEGLLKMQEVYENSYHVGRHLFEREKVNWNQYLPSPIPASFKVGKKIARIEERNQQLLAEFELAERNDIIRQDRDSGYWEIHTSDGKKIPIQTCRAVCGAERQVMLDFYLKAPVLNKIVQKELKKQNIES